MIADPPQTLGDLWDLVETCGDGGLVRVEVFSFCGFFELPFYREKNGMICKMFKNNGNLISVFSLDSC